MNKTTAKTNFANKTNPSKVSRSFKKTPIPVQDTYAPEEIAILCGIGINAVYAFANREHDPLPLRREFGRKRGGFALRDELIDWIKRNTTFGCQ